MASSELACLEVSYDDGPQHGLLVEISSDDVDEPAYLRFEEVHGRMPQGKVMFEDGLTMFLTLWPAAAKGILIDEDGDEHMYRRASVAAPPLGDGVAFEQDPASSEPAPQGKAALSPSEPKDGSCIPAEGSEPRHEHFADVTEVAAAGSDSQAAASREFVLDCSDEAPCQGAAGTAAPAEPAVHSHVERSNGALGLATEHAVKGNSNVAPPSALQTPQTMQEPQADIAASAVPPAPGLTSPLFFEQAKTARSICRTCGKDIAKQSTRCGMKAYSNGRTVVVWAHPRCFLERVAAEYCVARRGKCKGSGVAFQAGDVRVRFEVGGHTSWWSPGEAARWTSQAVACLSGDGGSDARSVLLTATQAMEADHRSALVELLLSGVEPNPKTMYRRRHVAAPASKRRKVCKDASAVADSSVSSAHTAGASQSSTRRDCSATEYHLDVESDVEFGESVDIPRSEMLVQGGVGTLTSAPVVLDADEDTSDDGFELVRNAPHPAIVPQMA